MKAYTVLLICACVIASAAGGVRAQDGAIGGAAPMELIGLDVTGSAGHHQLRFAAGPCASGSAAADTYPGGAISRSIDSFLLGLCMPDDAFWVNLTPESSAQSIDPEIAETDTGKILLAADLRLKKDTSSLTNPRTSPAGRKYWDLLYAKAAALGIDDIPIASRVWIIPGAVKISEGADSVRIAQSDLRVCLEAEHRSAGQKLTAQQRQLQDYSRQLMRELIVPELSVKVNESAAYGNLRQVYRALVLARWYKERFGKNEPSMTRALLTDVRSFPNRLPYGRDQIYRQYMDSLRGGDYDFAEKSSSRLCAYMELITRRYFSGGIDWRSVVFEKDSQTVADPALSRQVIFYFSIALDSRRQRPVQYARENIRVEDPNSMMQKEGDPSRFEEDLPAVSAFDTAIASILKQGLSLHRAMSLNL